MSSLHDLDFEVVEAPKPTPKPPSIPPVLSLDLRLRWLETVLYGSRPEITERKQGESKNTAPLARRAGELQRQLDGIVQNNDGLRKFMDHCMSMSYCCVNCDAYDLPQTSSMRCI